MERIVVERHPAIISQGLRAAGRRFAYHHVVADLFHRGVEIGQPFIEPEGHNAVHLIDQQVGVLVRGGLIVLGVGIDHHDVVVIGTGVEESGGRFTGTVRLEFLLGAKGDDAHGFGIGGFRTEDLDEEAADLFEMADEVAAGALAGSGEKLKMRRLNADPRVGRRGSGAGGQAHDQRQPARGPGHEDEFITGSFLIPPAMEYGKSRIFGECRDRCGSFGTYRIPSRGRSG